MRGWRKENYQGWLLGFGLCSGVDGCVTMQDGEDVGWGPFLEWFYFCHVNFLPGGLAGGDAE